ncbi:MAG: glycosyltransferase [Desulfobulbaceae bacterium]|nr:MAG: glycosyltransferase [Desulfobulbaceae bacterium]
MGNTFGKLASVVMCVNNSELFINEAIDSILNQTFVDFDFIIVENCSTDRSLDIILSYKDIRIKLYRTPIRNLSYNLNFGLLQADSKYIVRMDSDDISHSKRLEKQIEYLENNPDVAIVGSAIRIINGKNSDTKIITLPLENSAIRRRLPYKIAICHPSVTIRRDILLSYNGYEQTRYCQDIELWLRMARNPGVKFANLKDVLLDYRIHDFQSKSTGEAYYNNISILVKEALIQKRMSLLLAAFLKLIASRVKIRSF